MNKTYIPTLISLLLLFALHYYGSLHHLYYRIFWFDIMMHILGGISLALSIYWVMVTFFKNVKPSLARIIIYTFLAGFFWEMMETYNDIAGAPVGTTAYYIDTIKDLIDDTIGALIISIFLRRK